MFEENHIRKQSSMMLNVNVLIQIIKDQQKLKLRECSNVDMDLHFTKLINEFQYKKKNKNTTNANNYGSISHSN